MNRNLIFRQALMTIICFALATFIGAILTLKILTFSDYPTKILIENYIDINIKIYPAIRVRKFLIVILNLFL